jgi:hypothetical protein
VEKRYKFSRKILTNQNFFAILQKKANASELPKKIFYGKIFSIFVFRGNTQGVLLYRGLTDKGRFRHVKSTFF